MCRSRRPKPDSLGLSMQAIQDVVMVLNEAVGGASTMGQLVRALVYYAEYDAFMPVDVS